MDPVEAVTEFVSAYVESSNDHELEVRLGTLVNKQFHNGIPRSIFDELERDISDSGLVPVSTWSEIVDYFYVTSGGDTVRTRVSSDTTSMQIRSSHVMKRTCRVITFCRSDGGDEAGKVVLSREVALDDPPSTCIPTFVRIQQRKTFEDVREGGRVWRYDLSKTWAGLTRAIAERMQREGEPTYEVECELVDENGSYTGTRTPRRVAESLLMKTTAMMGDDPTAPLVVLSSSNERDGKDRRRSHR